MTTPIHDFLQGYNRLRFHIPAHGGMLAPRDITEVGGADNLICPSGIIAESERNAARLFAAPACVYSCGGATAAILAMIAAAVTLTGKRTVVASRASHRSVASAAALLDLDIVWAHPVVTPQNLPALLCDDTAAVIMTAVDYYGAVSDVAAVRAVCECLLLVDNAHGTYLRFLDGRHPIGCGADMCADSGFKTLTALTGGAYLHIGNADHAPLCRQCMALFASSSPSYLILESLDLCNQFLHDHSGSFARTARMAGEMKERLTSDGIPVMDTDPLRLTLNTARMGYTGHEYADKLRERDIEPEMADAGHVVLMFNIHHKQREMDYLYECISNIQPKDPLPPVHPPHIIRKAISIKQAAFAKRVTVKTPDAINRISAGLYPATPPCVPCIVPGETVSGEAAVYLDSIGVEWVDVVM